MNENTSISKIEPENGVEKYQCASDEEVLKISQKMIEKNYAAYEELAK